MSSYRKKSSSSEDGEVSGENSDHQDEDIVPTKVSNKKLWSNVMLDQTADDVIAGVNAFEGKISNWLLPVLHFVITLAISKGVATGYDTFCP